jgi:hypothetical protein
MPKIDKPRLKLPVIARTCRKLAKIAENWLNSPKIGKIAKK